MVGHTLQVIAQFILGTLISCPHISPYCTWNRSVAHAHGVNILLPSVTVAHRKFYLEVMIT